MACVLGLVEMYNEIVIESERYDGDPCKDLIEVLSVFFFFFFFLRARHAMEV
jgi:hypothetical protein